MKTPEERGQLYRREMARLANKAVTEFSHESKNNNAKKQRPSRGIAFQWTHVVATLEEVQQAIIAWDQDEALLRVISLKKDFKEMISNDKKYRTLLPRNSV